MRDRYMEMIDLVQEGNLDASEVVVKQVELMIDELRRCDVVLVEAEKDYGKYLPVIEKLKDWNLEHIQLLS